MGHIPREISRHVCFFLKEESGEIEGSVNSTKYRPSAITVGGLEITLLLNFISTRFVTHQKMKGFVTSLYSYEYEPHKDETDDEDDEINFIHSFFNKKPLEKIGLKVS